CPGSGRFWASAEYLLWTIHQGSSPPLVTASPPGTPPGIATVLGHPSTLVVFGDGDLDYNMLSGARFTAGMALSSCGDLGAEASYFFLGRRRVNFVAGSNGVPFLGRPFFDVTPDNVPGEAAQQVAFPGSLVGAVSVNSSSKLWGVEGNLRARLACGCNYRLDA